MSKGTTSGLRTLPSCSAPACGQTLYGMVRFCPFCGTEQALAALTMPPAAAPTKPTAAAGAGATSDAKPGTTTPPESKPTEQAPRAKPATQAAPVSPAGPKPPLKGFAADVTPSSTQPAPEKAKRTLPNKRVSLMIGVLFLLALIALIWRSHQIQDERTQQKESAEQADAKTRAAREAREDSNKAAAARDAQQRARQDAPRAQEVQRRDDQRQEAQRQEAARQEALRQEAQQRAAIERDAQQTAQREAQREAQRQEAAREAQRQQAADQARQRAEANQESSVPVPRARPAPAPIPPAPARNVAPVPDAAPTQRLARDLLRNAREQLRNKDYNAAISTANMARGYDPDNPDIAAIVRQANEEKQRALSNTTIN